MVWNSPALLRLAALGLLALGSTGALLAQTALKPVLKPDAERAQLKPIVKSPDGAATPTPSATLTPQGEVLSLKPLTRNPTPDPRAAKPEPRAPKPERKLADPADLENLLRLPPSIVARQSLRNYLLKHRDAPEAPRAMLRIATISESLNEPTEARAMYEAVLKTGSPAALRQQAQAGLGRVGAGAVAMAPFPPPSAPKVSLDAGVQAGEQALARGDYAAARTAYQLAIGAPATSGAGFTPQHAAALLGLGLAAELQGNLDEARRCYDLVLKTSPNSTAAQAATARQRDLSQPLVQ